MSQLKKDLLMTFSTGSCGNAPLASCGRKGISSTSAYFLFITCVGVVMRIFSDGGYSTVVTLGAAVQFFGFQMLLLKVKHQKSVAGISAKSLETYAFMLCTRLVSTICRQGYLPVDRSGDFVYQFADLLSLITVLAILKCVKTTHSATYQFELDTMHIARLYPICVIMAVFIHGDLNNSFIFDVIWTISMNLDTVAMLPQLWMLSKIGEVEGMTSHFVASLMVSRACTFSFWFYGFHELRRGDRFNIAGWQLIGAHGLQLLLSADFMYYYIVAWQRGKKMVLPRSVEI